jgi:phosphoribosylaminoimidazole-succinocarboxamide synthase
MSTASLEARAHAALADTIDATDLPGLGALYRGKVRDVYRTPERLVLVTTDRVSAFDHVLGTIPWKGQILTELALAAFDATADVCPNHVLSAPDPQVIVGRPLRTLPIELVVRGHLTGSLWRAYAAGERALYGLVLPEGLRKDEAFPAPIVTPTTKAEHGAHDAPISPAEIVAQGLASPERWAEAERIARALFARGQAWAAERGLILVDTKYELGVDDAGVLRVADEIHTPDSSRYWVAEGAAARFAAGAPQEMLDKERLRSVLIERYGWSGEGPRPTLTDETRVELAVTYAELYGRLMRRPFEPPAPGARARLEANLRAAGLLSG